MQPLERSLPRELSCFRVVPVGVGVVVERVLGAGNDHLLEGLLVLLHCLGDLAGAGFTLSSSPPYIAKILS